MYVTEYLLLFTPKSITTTFSDDFMPKLERLRQSAMTLDLASSLISASPPLTMLQARQSSGARRVLIRDDVLSVIQKNETGRKCATQRLTIHHLCKKMWDPVVQDRPLLPEINKLLPSTQSLNACICAVAGSQPRLRTVQLLRFSASGPGSSRETRTFLRASHPAASSRRKSRPPRVKKYMDFHYERSTWKN